MKILITETANAIGQKVAAQLAVEHEVILCDAAVDLREPAQVEPLVAGVQSVVHTALPRRILKEFSSDADRLDWAARGSYVLLEACQKSGVERALLMSNLSCFDTYPNNYIIDETWRPLPQADAASLGPVLAERVFREFARQGGLTTICLRFGAIDAPGGTSLELGADAVERALTMPIDRESYRWWLFHIADSERFPLRAAKGAPLSLKEAK